MTEAMVELDFMDHEITKLSGDPELFRICTDFFKQQAHLLYSNSQENRDALNVDQIRSARQAIKAYTMETMPGGYFTVTTIKILGFFKIKNN